jgi:hypothetical protein
MANNLHSGEMECERMQRCWNRELVVCDEWKKLLKESKNLMGCGTNNNVDDSD